MNFPSASHMGGVCERQIRLVHNVLNPLLRGNALQLDDEALGTLRPSSTADPFLWTASLIQARLILWRPTTFLTMKTKVVLPPPGSFQSVDLYCRKRWRRFQHLKNEFWTQRRKEFLLSLQQHQKWLEPHSNLCVGDIVIIRDGHLPRNRWQLSFTCQS